MELGTSVPLVGHALRLTYIENPGMAFGLEFGGQLFLAIFSLAASVGVFYYLYKLRDQKFAVRASLAMILGGAIGNLIDRVFYGVLFGGAPLFYGKVVDFIDVNFLHLSRFGIFNIADAAVSIGVVSLLIFHRALDAAEEPVASVTEIQGESSRENRNPRRGTDLAGSPVELENTAK